METDVAEKNIRAIAARQQREIESANIGHKVAHRVAFFAGTVAFIVLHIVLFGGWIAANSLGFKFDPYPFVALTTIVSLESIFLSAFVMLSQNELSRQAELRHNLDLQINLLAEKETTEIIRFLIKIGKRLGMSESEWRELQELSGDVDPEEILEKIVKVEGDTKHQR